MTVQELICALETMPRHLTVVKLRKGGYSGLILVNQAVLAVDGTGGYSTLEHGAQSERRERVVIL